MKVLIVDFDTVLAMLADEVLMIAGHDVQGPARDFREAMVFAKATAPDFAIVSVDLAKRNDGVPISKALQKYYQIPCMIITGRVDAILDYHDAAMAVLTKPFALSDLDTSIRCVKAMADGNHSGIASWPAPLVIFEKPFPPD